jgi:hypothetical protein
MVSECAAWVGVPPEVHKNRTLDRWGSKGRRAYSAVLFSKKAVGLVRPQIAESIVHLGFAARCRIEGNVGGCFRVGVEAHGAGR